MRRIRIKKFVNCLIDVRKGYIPNMGPLGPLLHVEKFVVGGWLWWKTKFSVHFSPKMNKNERQSIFLLASF